MERLSKKVVDDILPIYIDLPECPNGCKNPIDQSELVNSESIRQQVEAHKASYLPGLLAAQNKRSYSSIPRLAISKEQMESAMERMPKDSPAYLAMFKALIHSDQAEVLENAEAPTAMPSSAKAKRYGVGGEKRLSKMWASDSDIRDAKYCHQQLKEKFGV